MSVLSLTKQVILGSPLPTGLLTPLFSRLLGRPNVGGWTIKIDLGEIRWDGVDCIHLAQDRDQWRAIVYTIMNVQVP
jgi:hypothetical protein